MRTSLGPLIHAKLVADPTVAGLVTDVKGLVKVFPVVVIQQTAAPYVVFSVISDVPENTFDGTADEALRTARLQVDSYARGYVDAQTLAEAVTQVIANLNSPDLSAWRETSRDLFDEEAQFHRVSADYIVFY